MKLYFLRHAQSEHNQWMIKRLYLPRIFGTCSGIVDAPLSDIGTVQAQKLKNRIQSIPFDLIISSPLTRAIQTMQTAIGNRKIPVIVTPLIKEKFDRLPDSGLHLSVIQERNPEYEYLHFNALNWWESPTASTLPKHESFEDVKNRIKTFKKFILTRNEQHVLVVTHGVFIKTILNNFMMTKNCSVTCKTLEEILKINF